MTISRNSSVRQAVNQSKQALTTANLLKFPANDTAYFSTFNFVTYARNNPKVQAISTGSSVEITLPLPFNLKEQYSINYSGADLGWIEGGINAYNSIMSNPGTATAMDAASRVQFEEVIQAFTRSTFPNSPFVQQANRFTGTVVNPHMVNIFQNVNLRTHNFQWQLSPTSPEEALVLQNITRQFREKMHPTKRTEFILGFPDEVYVTMHGSSFLYPVFKSVVQDVQFDYTDGRPNAWFTDGAPVTFTLSITLQEVETLTREDFMDQPTEVTRA